MLCCLVNLPVWEEGGEKDPERIPGAAQRMMIQSLVKELWLLWNVMMLHLDSGPVSANVLLFLFT